MLSCNCATAQKVIIHGTCCSWLRSSIVSRTCPVLQSLDSVTNSSSAHLFCIAHKREGGWKWIIWEIVLICKDWRYYRQWTHIFAVPFAHFWTEEIRVPNRTGQTELTFEHDFPGNLWRAAFAILAMLFVNGKFNKSQFRIYQLPITFAVFTICQELWDPSPAVNSFDSIYQLSTVLTVFTSCQQFWQYLPTVHSFDNLTVLTSCQ